MLSNFFAKKKYNKISEEAEAIINAPPSDDNLWVQCTNCKGFVYEKQMRDNLMVCPKCGKHLRIGSAERIGMIADEGSFVAFDWETEFKDPIDFPGYKEKWENLRQSTGLKEGVLCGRAEIGGEKCVLCVMDSSFLMGSMGSILGEFAARAFETATAEGLPVVIFTASGGARMQEGIISLMQMAKVSAVVRRHSEAGLFYLSVITDPTTGGVTASFATLGDVIIGETGAIFGFAGRRVIEQTIGKKLPAHFQTTQFALTHGLLDGVYERRDMRDICAKLLKLHNAGTMARDGEDVYEQVNSEAKDISAWDRVTAARNNKRPSAMYYIKRIFDDFTELHGDRLYADDAAIVGGLAFLNGLPVTVIAEERGTDIRDRQKRNFGMPNPEGYRKALRLMKQAEKFRRPVIAFVDTQGAYCGDGAEERGQGSAIAENLSYMSGMTVPVISVFIGEGGSGGALAIGVANKVLMQENAVYSILSPEGFAAILWKDAARAKEAAGVMKMTASELLALGVVDEIIPEPAEGAHKNPELAAEAVKEWVTAALGELCGKSPETLRNERFEKFRRF